MPAPNNQMQVEEVPLKLVGGTHFGRYPKISLEQTWNFIVSDDWLVPYAGYKNSLTLSPTVPGRGIFSSYVGNLMIAIIGTFVYKITNAPNNTLQSQLVGNLYTNSGDVYIAENNNQEICITDNVYVYVYNWGTNLFSTSNPASSPNTFSFPFQNPGYISFQNGRLIIASGGTTNWVLSGANNAMSWQVTGPFVGALQSKPDFVQAAVPVPGAGNNLLVFGRNVTELWQDVGNPNFPYQKNTSKNIDYGCINPATISHLHNHVVWIGVNEQSGPVVMYSQGTDIEQISTDGIDYQLGNLSNPFNCTGFLYQQDGHLLYQFTFPDDNISYAYDFETKLFFNVSDENLNYHIAREIVYFNNTYYFVSLNGGNIYEFDTLFSAAQYSEDNIQIIPRIRITQPARLPNQRYYIVRSLAFTMEQGQLNQITTVNQMQGESVLGAEADPPTVIICCENGDEIGLDGQNEVITSTSYFPSEAMYLSISRDGGENFGNQLELPMNPTGVRKSRVIFQRLGIANDTTYKLVFSGYSRFVINDAILELFQ